jgi:hypothetical protein
MSKTIYDKLTINVCKISCDDGDGTGFLISNDLVLTAFHVVNNSEQLIVKPNNSSCEIISELHELITDKYKSLDIAVLKLQESVDFYENISFTDIVIPHNKKWISRGYPQFSANLGENILEHPDNIVQEQNTLHMMNDIRLDFNKKLDTYQGFSGSPLIIDDLIVGIIKDELLEQGTAKELRGLSTKYFRDLLEQLGVSIINKTNPTIPRTITNNILNEVDKHFDVVLDNDNNLKVFTPKLDGKEHDIENFVNELYESIHTFMGNRLDLDLPRQEQMKSKLRKKFKERYSNKLVEELIGYNFLETDLNAPKIFTTVEHDEMNFSVHLHELEDEKIFVLSLPVINTNLESAIDDIEILLRTNNDFKINSSMITESFLRQSFEDEHKEFIKSLVIPSINPESIIENAYGIFLGFDLSEITNKNKLRVRQFIKVYKKTIDDISQKVNQIFQDNLMSLSPDKYFFIYIVPFDSTKNLFDTAERVLND